MPVPQRCNYAEQRRHTVLLHLHPNFTTVSQLVHQPVCAAYLHLSQNIRHGLFHRPHPSQRPRRVRESSSILIYSSLLSFAFPVHHALVSLLQVRGQGAG